MKVLLIKPEYVNILTKMALIKTEPLELEYMQSICKNNGIESEICDLTINHQFFKKTLKRFKPDIIAITANFVHIYSIKKYVKTIKKFNPDIKIIIGGPHAEVVPEDFEFDGIDCIIYSGGFVPFENIIKSGSELDFSGINGICYIKDGKWIKNEREYFDAEKLPLPDRTHFYRNIKQYYYVTMSPCAIVKTSYSCPHNCNYCFATLLNGGCYMCRQPRGVIEEIKQIECDNIWIVDDTFYVDKGKLDEFIELNKQERINKNYSIYYRADFISENEDYIRRLSEIGVRMCAVGLEVIDDEVLEKYNKNSNVHIILEALRILKKFNIKCVSLFMIDIDADKSYFKKLYNFIKKHKLYLSTISILTPMPGTEQFEKYKDRIITYDYRKWDFLHLTINPTKMSKSTFYFKFFILHCKLGLLLIKNKELSVKYLFSAVNVSFEYWIQAAKDIFRRQK